MAFKDLCSKTVSQGTLLVLALAGSLFAQAVWPLATHASIPNHLYRVEIRPKPNHTRINIKFADPPQYELESLSGNRLRLIVKNSEGPLFKKYRRYSDKNIGGLVFSRRKNDLMITFQYAAGAGWHDLHQSGVSAIALDVGKGYNSTPQPYVKGRERIWNGLEKLVRDFDPPLKAEIPFVPTDRAILKNILAETDQQAFMAAEAALYKGSLSQAEEGFTQFASKQAPIRGLALYRLGETLYKLQKYGPALAAFREAEKLWPAYMNFNPAITFYFGDSIARSGDLAAGRSVLIRMIAQLADKTYAPALLVRMGDILSRQGHEKEALGIYNTVAANFKESKASLMARLRLADREFFRVSPWSYRGLSSAYKTISQEAEDPALREESLFKHVLLESIFGGSPEALQQVVLFQKKFPRGDYAAVCRTIREVLVAEVYRQTRWEDDKDTAAAPDRAVSDKAGLIRFVEEHQEYLAGCVEQPDFLPQLVKAYEEKGSPLELIKLFSVLQDRQWAAPGLPFIYEQISDKADLLGDSILAEKSIHSFLSKFPNHPRKKAMLERLGWLYFADGKPKQASETLMWLLNKGERAVSPESYYYLGRSLWTQKQNATAIKAMDMYLSLISVNDKEQARRLPDAYFITASARESTGDRKGALRMLEAGRKLPPNARSEEFTYKAAQLYLQEGRHQVARDYLEYNVKAGKDEDWRKLSQQSLDIINNPLNKK